MIGPEQLVARLGGHPAARLGLDLDTPEDLFGWLLAACLLAARAPEERALAAYRALDEAGLLDPGALGAAAPARVADCLARAGLPRAERPALLLTRLAGSLAGPGALCALLAQALDLEDLGGRLVALAPGLGGATALRYLRPLRGRFAAAGETPLAAPALSAARHLGWLAEGDDDPDAAALLAGVLGGRETPSAADLEAALERLGRTACAAERRRRCPLAEACPLR